MMMFPCWHQCVVAKSPLKLCPHDLNGAPMVKFLLAVLASSANVIPLTHNASVANNASKKRVCSCRSKNSQVVC